MDDLQRIESQLQGIHDQLSYQNTLLTTAAVAYMERQRKQAMMQYVERKFQDEYYRLTSAGLAPYDAHHQAMLAVTTWSWKWWYRNWWKRDYFVWAGRWTVIFIGFVLMCIGWPNNILWAWLDHVVIGHPFSTDGHYNFVINWSWMWAGIAVWGLVWLVGIGKKHEIKSGDFFRNELGVTI